MPNYCDVCRPELVVAHAKMLVRSSDPSVTLWVCEACATSCAHDDSNVIGTEAVVDELWEREEAARDELWEREEEARTKVIIITA